MGSSSVSCALTGVTLNNQPAVLIPLAPARFPCGGTRRHPSPGDGARIISNEGAAGLFGALTLPLFGRVGDVGDFEFNSLEDDASSRFLRQRFGSDDSFHSFLQSVVHGGKHSLTTKMARLQAQSNDGPYRKRLTWDGNLRGCWVAREAWDYFSTHSWEDYNERPDTTAYEDGWLDPQVLKGMGFIRGTKDVARATALLGDGPHNGPRHHTPYTHPELPGLEVWCDEHMSSECVLNGTKITVRPKGKKYTSEIYHVAQLVEALAQHKIKFPAEAEAWARSVTRYRAPLLAARKEMARDRKSARRHAKFREEHPQCTWDLISDTTPKAVRDRNHARVMARVHRTLKTEGEELSSEVAEEEEETVPGGIEQLHWCEGPKPSEGWLLTVRGPGGRQPPESWTVTRGPRPEGKEDWSASRIEFSPELWAELKEAGWVLPRERRRSYYTSDPYVRMFPEETLRLYRGHFLDDEMLPLIERFMVFTCNLSAANGMLAPTNSGFQCGHPRLQAEVARMALRISRERQARRRRNR